MYSLPVPVRSGTLDYESISERRREPSSREALFGVRDIIIGAYTAYIMCEGDGAAIWPIPLSGELASLLAGNFRLLEKGASHQHIRDEVLSSARFDICPYCSATPVDTIDHMLPVALYPEFSVLAQNLIPCCGRCNRSKGPTCFVNDGKDLFHPYFQKVPAGQMLRAYVEIVDRFVTWSFAIEDLPGMDGHAFARMRNLFEILELDELYRQVSVPDVIDRLQSMEIQHQAGGTEQVRLYLQLEAESARVRRGENYWKTAILVALAASSEFCAGGFRYLLREV